MAEDQTSDPDTTGSRGLGVALPFIAESIAVAPASTLWVPAFGFMTVHRYRADLDADAGKMALPGAASAFHGRQSAVLTQATSRCHYLCRAQEANQRHVAGHPSLKENQYERHPDKFPA